jgi:hypothetical protein
MRPFLVLVFVVLGWLGSHIRLIDSIDSAKNDEGNEFRAASLDDPIRLGDAVVAAKRANVSVTLATEKDSGNFTGKTELSVQLLSFTVDGKMVPVNTTSVTRGSGSRGARTAKSAAAVGAVASTTKAGSRLGRCLFDKPFPAS